MPGHPHASATMVGVVADRNPTELDRELVRAISDRLGGMHRFALVDSLTLDQAVGDQEFASTAQFRDPSGLATKLGADVVLLADTGDGAADTVDRSESDSEDKKRTDDGGVEVVETHKETIHFSSRVSALIKIFDAASHEQQELPLVAEETSDDSEREAERSAIDAIAAQLADHLKTLFPLHAAVVARSGRTVTLGAGYDQGLDVDTYLRTDGDAIVRVDQVDADSSTGRLVHGYYHLRPDAALTEDFQGGVPGFLGIGYVNRTIFGPKIQATVNALELHLNDSGVDGPDLVGEIGYTSHISGIGALDLTFHVDPQLEVIPEIFWLDASLGASLNTFTLRPLSDTALSSLSLHALGAVGARLALPLGFKLSASVGYQTPWTVSSWSKDLGDGDSVQVVGAGLPTFTIGGAFAMGSVCLGF